jgi:hypothetical protein
LQMDRHGDITPLLIGIGKFVLFIDFISSFELSTLNKSY